MLAYSPSVRLQFPSLIYWICHPDLSNAEGEGPACEIDRELDFAGTYDKSRGTRHRPSYVVKMNISLDSHNIED
jgi:hypothetical protein